MQDTPSAVMGSLGGQPVVPGPTSRACLLLDALVVLVLWDLKTSSPRRGCSQVSGWILGPRLGPPGGGLV